MSEPIQKKVYIADSYDMLPDAAGDIVLRSEREKRRMSREEFAEKAEISVAWLRTVETGRERPGAEARERIRRVLEVCPVHADLGVSCSHKLPVPPDDELYAKKSAQS